MSPGRIADAAVGVSAHDLREPLEPGGWSARDILAHIRACDRTWGGYIERILGEDHPSFRAESPRTTIASDGLPRTALRRLTRRVHARTHADHRAPSSGRRGGVRSDRLGEDPRPWRGGTQRVLLRRSTRRARTRARPPDRARVDHRAVGGPGRHEGRAAAEGRAATFRKGPGATTRGARSAGRTPTDRPGHRCRR